MPLMKQKQAGNEFEQKDMLRSSFQSYNSYRGDMEQSRQAATDTFNKDMTSAKATMASNSTKRGSGEWNRTVAGVLDKRNQTMAGVESEFEKYKAGPEYSALTADYEKTVGTDLNKARTYNENMLQREMQGSALTPTFDEYVDSEYGDEQQQAAVKTNMAMRRQNETRTTK